MRKKKAFSLIETLVVLAISAILLGLAITSMVSLRNNTIVKQAVTEFIENSNTVRNAARNSLLNRQSVDDSDISGIVDLSEDLDYYAIVFSQSEQTYFKGTCSVDEDTGDIACVFSQNDLKGKESDIVNVYTADEDCTVILYSLSTGDYTFAKNLTSGAIQVAPQTKNKCVYRFEHAQTQGVYFDLELDRTISEFNIL
jgi:prepilin-type N-terminal cleavage/methylation domain-containing protein